MIKSKTTYLPIDFIHIQTLFVFIVYYVCQSEVSDGAQITATVYLPSQGRMAVGRSNGSIILLPAAQCIMLQLLDNNQICHDSK